MYNGEPGKEQHFKFEYTCCDAVNVYPTAAPTAPTWSPTPLPTTLIPTPFPTVEPTNVNDTLAPVTAAPTVSPTLSPTEFQFGNTSQPTSTPTTIYHVDAIDYIVDMTSELEDDGPLFAMKHKIECPNEPLVGFMYTNLNPTSMPTGIPSSSLPTSIPSSSFPTSAPSMRPSTQPSSQPSTEPSSHPSMQPSTQPTSQPTSIPSMPTSIPSSAVPSSVPSSSCPSNIPTAYPTSMPTIYLDKLRIIHLQNADVWVENWHPYKPGYKYGSVNLGHEYFYFHLDDMNYTVTSKEADYMCPGSILAANETMFSSNGLVRLSMQSDGNMVIYENTTLSDPTIIDVPGVNSTNGTSYFVEKSIVLGSTDTWGVAEGGNFTFEMDGNLVVSFPNGSTAWESGTVCDSCVLKIQNDGNIAMYNASGYLFWSTGKETFHLSLILSLTPSLIECIYIYIYVYLELYLLLLACN